MVLDAGAFAYAGEMTKWLRENHDLLESICWVVLGIPTVIWWKESVLWVAIMSLYANSKGAQTAWKAEKAKRAAKD